MVIIDDPLSTRIASPGTLDLRLQIWPSEKSSLHHLPHLFCNEMALADLPMNLSILKSLLSPLTGSM